MQCRINKRLDPSRDNKGLPADWLQLGSPAHTDLDEQHVSCTFIDVEQRAAARCGCACPQPASTGAQRVHAAGCTFGAAHETVTLELLRSEPPNTVLFQAALRIPPWRYAALGLGEAHRNRAIKFSRLKPDYLVIVARASNGAREVAVIDAKATRHVRAAHQVQVALYAEALALNGFEPSPVGAVWQPMQVAPGTRFELGELRAANRRVLREQIAPMLSEAAYDRPENVDQPWRLSKECAICPQFSACRSQAVAENRLSTLPYVSVQHESFLRGLIEAAGPAADIEGVEIEDIDEIGALRMALVQLPARPDLRTRSQLSTAIHLAFDDDDDDDGGGAGGAVAAGAARSSVAAAKLRAVETGTPTLTGWPSVSLPYVSTGEVCCIVLTIQLEPKSEVPYGWAFRCFERVRSTGTLKCGGELSQAASKQSWASKSEFTARGAQASDGVCRRLVCALHALFGSLARKAAGERGPRAFVCTFSAREARALSDMLLRMVLDGRENSHIVTRASELARVLGLAHDARLIDATRHTALVGNPTTASAATAAAGAAAAAPATAAAGAPPAVEAADELFLPRLVVLEREIRRLLVLPAVSFYEWGDCVRHLAPQYTEHAATVTDEAIFRDWSLDASVLWPQEDAQRAESYLGTRVEQLLRFRVELVRAMLQSTRAYAQRAAITVTPQLNPAPLESQQTQDLSDPNDAHPQRHASTRLLPFKAARVSFGQSLAIQNATLSRLAFFAQLESTADYEVRRVGK